MKTSYYEPTKILASKVERKEGYDNQNGVFKYTKSGHKILTGFDLGILDTLPQGQTRDLYSVVEIGDDIWYDVGKWNLSEISKLESNSIYTSISSSCRALDRATFFGFSIDSDKNSNAIGFGHLSNGWKVLEKFVDEQGNRCIAIVHSGIPEMFFYKNSIDMLVAVSKRNFSEYVNPTYATYAKVLNRQHVEKLMDSSLEKVEDMLVIGEEYLLCEEFSLENAYIIQSQGNIATASAKSFGIRIVVYLKPNLQTCGKNIKGEWTLVEQ